MKKKADLIDADYPDYIPLPDTIALAGRLKSTLQVKTKFEFEINLVLNDKNN